MIAFIAEKRIGLPVMFLGSAGLGGGVLDTLGDRRSVDKYAFKLLYQM